MVRSAYHKAPWQPVFQERPGLFDGVCPSMRFYEPSQRAARRCADGTNARTPETNHLVRYAGRHGTMGSGSESRFWGSAIRHHEHIGKAVDRSKWQSDPICRA